MAMEQIDPAIYDILLTSGSQIGGMDPQIQHTQNLAKYLRTMGAAPQMRMSGRRAVAPSWLEMAGALANQGLGARKDMEAMDLAKTQATLRSQQMQDILDALRGRTRQPNQTPAQIGQAVQDPYYTQGAG